MDALLVSGSAVAGLLVGGALDPVGQRLADRSRTEDELPGDELPGDEAGTEDIGERPPVESTTVGLLTSGPSVVRRVGAALTTAALWGAAAVRFGPNAVLAPFSVLFALLVVLSVTDLSHRLVPRRLLYPGLALIVPLLVTAAAVDHSWHSLTGAFVAGAVAFIVFFLTWWFVPKGMGFGDVRLAGTIGLAVGYLSLLHAYIAFLVAFVLGAFFGLVIMSMTAGGRRTRIPFAPALALGAVIATLWGSPLAQSLFHTVG